MNQGIASSTQPAAVGVTEVYPCEAHICGDDILYLVPFRSYRFRRPDCLQVLSHLGLLRARVQGFDPHFFRATTCLRHLV